MASRRRRGSKLELNEVAALPEAIKDKRYDRHEIEGLLDSLPGTIAKADMALAQCENNLEQLEQDLKVMKAKYHLKASVDKEELSLTNAEDRKAYVETQPDVIDMCNQIIVEKGNKAVLRIQLEKYDRLFTSIRKQANMIISEDQLTMNSDKGYTKKQQ